MLDMRIQNQDVLVEISQTGQEREATPFVKKKQTNFVLISGNKLALILQDLYPLFKT